MKYPDLKSYEGEFAMGQEHGMGKMTWPDGSTHQGRFRFGVRDGPGVYTREDGLKEKKIWKDDALEAANAFDLSGSSEEELGAGKENPLSLADQAQERLARVVREDPLLYPSAALQRVLPRHLKEVVAKEFVEHDASLSAVFKETVPKIAWEFIPEIRYCNNRMIAQEVTMMMYFLECNRVLKTLHLQAAGLNESGAKQFANIIDKLTVLEELNLSWNSMRNDGLKVIASNLHRAPTLKKLHVAGCGIGNTGASSIAEILGNNECALQLLNMSFNSIGPLGCKALSECIATNVSLACLNLRSNSIGPDGAEILSKGLLKHQGSLKQLHIADNQIGNEMATLIAGCLKGTTADLVESFDARSLGGPLYVKEGVVSK
uniref:Uncharacterized protein n=1 Tax=Heterosigma akashiwo TaxID=2829 RepID=A0A7S3Y4C0_HETAK